ncbi:non-ribosomal peptide synthetase [Paenibacillus sp. UMB4589-SE434]|uniref:non-ribosomal peptide synthetase n=1 Tax=Paenibacillus sp. UMB4589-SE434 TaxID=3046314 RepID=UPI00254FDECE|nr:non-ribosomal peptide synthetase [Paenibacillus sp. UMB4589-SE434]MDK8181884.1 amino acid adenylation domain-containing protein [Paenibacillus sp. UMB4589-SE434]
MRFFALLHELMLKGIAFKVDEGRLRYSDEGSVMTESMRAELLAYRPEFTKLTGSANSFQLAPVSPAQQAMWMMHQFYPESTAYNTVLGLRLTSQVDEHALEQACQQLTERHPALRSTFRSDGPDVLQVIHNQHRVWWQTYDCRAFSVEQARAEMTRRSKEPFRLERGALFRAELFRMDDHCCLVLTAHHIIMDAWSYHLIVEQLEACYRAKLTGREVILPPLDCQYEDFVLQQHQMLAGPKGESLAAYWCDRLSGELPSTHLPVDYPRQPVQRGNGDSVAFELDSALLGRLSAAAQETGSTLYVTLLAAYLVLLHRYSGQEELLVGTPATGRTKPEWAGVVGYFINAVVIRADCAGEPTFASFTSQVKRAVLAALEHQEYPFALLLDKLGLKPDPSRQQLLQVMFVFIDDIRKAQQANSTSTSLWTPFDLPSEEGQNDLMLVMTKLGERFAGALRYDADLFERDTVSRMADSFLTLLHSIADNPHLPISKLPIVSAAERTRQLVQWNDTAASYPREFRLHELFEQQAERTPHAVAVVDSNTSLTYAQLNRYSNEVATALITRGVVPDDRVCILEDRGCDFLIAMLGIFKSGAAYIPLDPRHPSSRHLGIIRDSDAQVLLTSSDKSKPLIQEANQMKLAMLPIKQLYGKQSECRNPHIRVSADHLAYVIYTSGSTGKPKGAMVEQRGMLNHLFAKINDLSLGPGDVVVQNASQCFDISVWQFLSAIVVGGTTRIVEDELVMDPVPFLDVIAAARTTILEMVPSLLHAVLDVIQARPDLTAKLHSLRWMIVTGEALPPNLCVRWFARYAHVPMMNAYGPTECSDDVAHYVLYAPPEEHRTIMPIGRSIQNTRLYILDRYLEPVPIGVTGELYVAGEGVGRGYLNDPERTKQAFLIDHLAAKPGGRLYRTGDRAKYLANGDIEYHGRIDYQVKVRGFRIELGEIEAAMQKLAGIKEAVVVAKGEALEDKTLVAFWIADAETAFSSSADGHQAFKRILGQALPEYMVPAVWLRLQQFPLSANGKIDRNWLTANTLNDIGHQYGVDVALELSKGHASAATKGESGTVSNDAVSHREWPNTGNGASSQSEKMLSHQAAAKEAISTPVMPSEKELRVLLQGWLEQDVGSVIAEMMNLAVTDLDRRANLIESGFNSIKFITLSAKLDELYGIRIAPPQFFDFATTTGIIHYLLSNYQEQLTSSYVELLQRWQQGSLDTDCTEGTDRTSNDSSATLHRDEAVPFHDAGKQAALDLDELDVEWMESAVAIIGMDARTPGARNVSEMWNNLVGGVDVITEIPADRWDWRQVSGEHTKARWGGFIADVDKFDAGFFGVPEEKARQMDPQQRLMLEASWKAVEDAGYKMSELSTRQVGVFMAVAYTDYMDVLRESGHNLDLHAAAGMERTLIPNMISHYFDLTGPSEAVDTACSSSLTALSRGVEALRSGVCDTAIIGASNLILSPRLFTVFDELGKLSSDGRCKTFDKDADGYVRSEGVITVVLKPLKAAIADHDHIHAVIRGCTTRHIGRSSAFTAPKSTSQSDLIKETYKRHSVDLCSLGYVEMHGPGISLVDAVEVNALSKTMKESLESGSSEAKASFACGIGSVKSNLGHMEAAGGLAGLLKIVLSMQHGIIPANVNIQELNPYLELEDSPLYVIQENTPWHDTLDTLGQRKPRRAGISSFGGGGVIAHAIVEEHFNKQHLYAEEPAESDDSTKREYAIPLSAKSERSLRQYAAELAAFIQPLLQDSLSDQASQRANRIDNTVKERPYRLMDIAYTLQSGREEFEERLGLTAAGLDELHRKLLGFAQGKMDEREYYRGTVQALDVETEQWTDHIDGKKAEAAGAAAKLTAEQVVQQWATGSTVEWDQLYERARPYRVPLPTYPFHKDRYWVEVSDSRKEMVAQV